MNKVNKEYMSEFAKTMKIGLVASIDESGDPHISILSTLMAKSEDKMMLGEFVGGKSKEQLEKVNHKSGFLIMNLNKEFWTGRMQWTNKLTEGEDYVMYNMQPKYRYNSYFGIHTVHYFDLKDISDKNKLDMGGIVINALKVAFVKGFKKSGKKNRVLKPWAEGLMKKMDTLKFLSFVDEEGYPNIIPIIQAQANGSDRIVISKNPYGAELSKIKPNSRVAVFGLNLQMENVLMKGVFSGFNGAFATFDIDRVYNSMPPKMGYIYPENKTSQWEIEQSIDIKS